MLATPKKCMCRELPVSFYLNRNYEVGHIMDDLDFMIGTLEILEAEYQPDSSWDESPYGWLLGQPSGTKGAIARKLVTQWASRYETYLKGCALDNQRFLRSDDVIYQVKSSTMWKTGKYRFQQFRKGPYDHVVLLGLAPHGINIWVVPAEVIETHVIGSNGQHTGVGASETDWYEVDPNWVPHWLDEWGGTPEAAGRILSQIS